MDAIADRAIAADKEAERIWRTPNTCAVFDTDAPPRMLPGGTVRITGTPEAGPPAPPIPGSPRGGSGTSSPR